MDTIDQSDSTSPSKRRFWRTWQIVVTILGTPLLGWILLAPPSMQLPQFGYLAIWLAIFLIAAAGGLIFKRS
ncbi:hypothetical protein Q7C18_08855 [Nesterenkonia sp. CL21]|uniref:hypothetical protein n=1 Tax=Nesterenkonia sp. CL21 TaxID=3064894 RepID=UPI002878B0EC|nr:hypothetical protein [Nesterenkonia sp. CL21]MDS2172802.1 hypothetical protein [Nesterenkonia sp. CL21]